MAKSCYKNLGTVLSLLDRASSCYWGCRNGDHIPEYLATRVCSSAHASLRLLLLGYYDESLSITRSVGEIANLLLLFQQDAAAFQEWREAPEPHRKAKFSPVKVRLRLEAIGRGYPTDFKLLIMDERRYAALSELATHVTPRTNPQAHNPLEIACSGGIFQSAGVIVALQELAAATARAALPLPRLLDYDSKRHDEIQRAAALLLSSTGRLNVLTEKQMFADMREIAGGADPLRGAPPSKRCERAPGY